MNKVTVFLCSLVLTLCVVAPSGASPVYFDVASAPSSSVRLSNVSTLGWTNLYASLVRGLGDNRFTLNDGESRTIDFFLLQATGILGGGTADISATLAFDNPLIAASGSGDVGWGTFAGVISGGYLNWDESTLPDVITLSDGNRVRIDFEDGIALGIGDTATVHAYITNLGAAVAPVPEPGTMVLLGAGLLGLGLLGRKKVKLHC